MEPQKHPSFTFCLISLLIHTLKKTNYGHFVKKVSFRFLIARVSTDLASYIASILNIQKTQLLFYMAIARYTNDSVVFGEYLRNQMW